MPSVPNVDCHVCGQEITCSRESRKWVCPACGVGIDPAPWRELWAVEALVERVLQDPDLPDDLGSRIVSLLAKQRESIEDRLALQRGATPSAAARIGPPPLPPPVEHRPTASAMRVEAAAQAARTRRQERERRQAERREQRRSKAEERKARGPGVWERLGPATAENLGFALAAFLIVAGAVYFTTTAWTTMSGEQRLLVVTGGLLLLAAVLYGAGRLLNRGGTLPEVERVLLLVCCLLVPVSIIPTGNLLRQSLGLGLLGTALAIPAAFFFARALARFLDARLAPFLPVAFTLLASFSLAGGPAGTYPVLSATIAAIVLLVAVHVYARRIVPKAGAHAATLLWPPLLLAFVTMVFAGRLALSAAGAAEGAGPALAAVGILLSAVGVALVRAEDALFRRGVFGEGRSNVLLVVSIALGVTGTVLALGDPIGLVPAAALGAWAGIVAGLALPVPWMAIVGLVLAALAYLRSPVPFKAALLHVRDQAAAALGYVDKPLPLAYYGLTFLPYVAACAFAGWRLLRRDRRAESRVLVVWTLVTAGGLALLSLLTSGDPAFSDLRAPAGVLTAQGALLFALGWVTRDHRILFGGTLGIYGGAACAAFHFTDDPATALLALSLLGIVGLGLTAVLARRRRPPARKAQVALLGSTAVLAVGLVLVGLFDMLGPAAASWWHALGYLALSALFVFLGFAYRLPAGILLGSLALAGAADRFLAAVVPGGSTGLYVLFCALLSALPLLAGPTGRRFPARMRHPALRRTTDPAVWAPAGSAILQLAGLQLLLARPLQLTWSWPLAAGLLVGAVVLAIGAHVHRQRWAIVVAACELVIGALAAAGAGGAEVYGTGGLLAFAIAMALLYVFVLTRRPRRLAALAGTAGLHAPISFVPAVSVTWAGLLLAARIMPQPYLGNGFELAGACLLVALCARVSYGRLRNPIAADMTAIAGLLFGPAAVGILGGFDAQLDWYPLGLVVAAIATVVWARGVRPLKVTAGIHLYAALAFAVGLAAADHGEPLHLLVAFAVLAGCGRIHAASAPLSGGILMLLACLFGLSFVLFVHYVPIPIGHQPALWIAFAALALLGWRVPGLGLSRRAARAVAWPVLTAGYLGGALTAATITLLEPPSHHASYKLDVAGARWAAAALLFASVVWSIGGRTALRRAAPLFAAALGVFVYAPVNLLLHGGDARLWRPDVEIALLAAALACVLPLTGARVRHGRLGRPVLWPLLLAALGLILTWAALEHASTPLACLLATITLFVLVLRDRGHGLGRLAGVGVLLTACATVAWLRPASGPLVHELRLLFAATAALTAPLLWGLARVLRRGESPNWRRRAAAELSDAAVLGTAVALVLVGLDTYLAQGVPAGGLALALAALAFGVPGLGAAWNARRLERPHLVHISVLALVGFYAFVALRTDALTFLDGFHLHAVLGLGGTLMLLSEWRRHPITDLLALDGLLLALPATVVHAPAALGLTPDDGGASSALALAALVSAHGARRLSRTSLWWVAVALINLVLYAFWRRHGILDPAFYGVPPGLSLVAGAVVLRKQISPQARLGLLIPGLALLYGSVALQVVRVGNPGHALVLFAMGIATVALGFRFRRNAWLVTGMVVIVLDVVAYLATHGFETGFFGAALLIGAGLSVFAVAALTAKRRRAEHEESPPPPTDDPI